MASSKQPDIRLGKRVRLSELGQKRIRTIEPNEAGLVVRISRTGNALGIKFPGRKSALTLHTSYVEPLSCEKQ